MARYLVLIYGDEKAWADASDEWVQENSRRHAAFAESAGEALIGGHELEPTDMATSLRTDSAGKLTATDGPFVETKEAIGGYYLLEAPDLDEAIRLAGLIPESTAATSGVEIRPVHG